MGSSLPGPSHPSPGNPFVAVAASTGPDPFAKLATGLGATPQPHQPRKRADKSDFFPVETPKPSLLHLSKQQQEQQQQQQHGIETAHRRQQATQVRRTTMTTTTLSLPRASRQQPIIVLHEAPTSPQLNHGDQQLPVTPSRRRHSRRHNTPPTAQLLPEVLLAPGVLETILINNGSASSSSGSSM